MREAGFEYSVKFETVFEKLEHLRIFMFEYLREVLKLTFKWQ